MIKSVYLEITNACNLNCNYCYNKSQRNSLNELFIFEIQKVITYCRENKADIILSGGEPFLFSSIKELLEIIKSENEITFHIVTNGTLVPFEHIKNIKNLCLHISLDSTSSSLNALTRGEYDHKSVIHLIQALGKAQNRFYVNMVITKKNMGEIADLFEFVVTNHGIPQFSFVQYQSAAIKNWSSLCLTTAEKINCLKTIHKLNEESKIKSNSAGCFSMCPITKKFSKLNIAIDVFGRIYPCQSARHDSLLLGTLGDVSNLIDLYPKIITIQDVMSKRRIMDFGCNKCYLANVCFRGCLSEANNKYHDLFANDDNCEIRRWQYLFLLKGAKNEPEINC